MGAALEPSVPKVPPGELVFGRYQIIRRLAVGGMGEVFLARQSGVAGFDRLVILKSLLPDLAAQDDFVNQFLDEARVAATLNHPSLVSIYEVGQWNGTYFIAMEYIRGDNLSRLQRAAERQGKRVPIDVAVTIIHHAAQALDHAHKATDLEGRPLQIVHRDISPQNIMVRTDGVTKVVDFGIAKAANRSSRTATGTLKGKVQYMAPEQVHCLDLDGRADQFSLGVVLWEMLAGRKLFQGNNEIEILRNVVSTPIPAIRSLAPDVTAELASTVERMLAKERSDRFASLAEAAHELKRFLDVAGERNAQVHTAEFVEKILGEEITAKTLDLTPSGANNFVVQLGQSQSPGTSPTRAAVHTFPPKQAAIGVAAGVTLAAAIAVIAVVVLWLGGAPQPSALAAMEGPPRSMVEAASAVLARPEPSHPMAPRYLLDSTPPGAEVREGSVLLGTTPLDTEKLTANEEHKLLVALQGHEAVSLTVKLRAGETYRDKVVLPALRTPPEASPRGASAMALMGTLSAPSPSRPTHATSQATSQPTSQPTAQPTTQPTAQQIAQRRETDLRPGLLTLNTSPWAKAYIDGKYIDSTPIAKLELSAGPHSVRLVNEAIGVDTTRSITIIAGEHLKQSWPLK